MEKEETDIKYQKVNNGNFIFNGNKPKKKKKISVKNDILDDKEAQDLSIFH